MKYISQWSAFTKKALALRLSPSSVVVYMYLFEMNNTMRWKERISIPDAVICSDTGLSRSTVIRARKELQDAGMIDVSNERAEVALSYHLIELHSESMSEGGGDE